MDEENQLDPRLFDPDLEIDFMDLQPAVAMQSSLYGYYSDKAVDARAERDSVANQLTIASADVELEIRKKLADSKEKVTESIVTANVAKDSRIIDLKAELVEKNKALNRLDAKVKALDKRNTMIECAVRMQLSRSNGTSLHGVSETWAGDNSRNEMRRRLNGKTAQ